MCDDDRRDLNDMSLPELARFTFDFLLENYAAMEALNRRQQEDLAKSPDGMLKTENATLRYKNQRLKEHNEHLNEWVIGAREENSRLLLRIAELENPRETPAVFVKTV